MPKVYQPASRESISQFVSHSTRKKPLRYNGSIRFKSQWSSCKNVFLRLFLHASYNCSILRPMYATEYIAQIQQAVVQLYWY